MAQDALEAFHRALLADDPVALYDRAPCGYLSTTPHGRILKSNATFRSWTGYDEDQLVGRPFTDLLTGGGRIFHETHYMPLLRMQGSVREIALDLRRADGSLLPVLLNATLDDPAHEPATGTGCADEGGAVVRVAVFDATERRSYELELLRAKEAAERAEQRSAALARTLQRTLLPPQLPTVPGLELAAAYQPAGDGSEVGGDFFDVFQGDADAWYAMLGDVSGKGVEAAVVTALVRHTTRALTVPPRPPGDILRDLNRVVLQHETTRFCSATLMLLRPAGRDWQVTLASAGHPPALHLRTGREPREVGPAGTLVGLFPDPDLQEVEVRVRPGEALVLYTDGVTEARRGTEFYGAARLAAVAAASAGSASSLASAVADDAMAFQDGKPRDDVAVLAIKVPVPVPDSG